MNDEPDDINGEDARPRPRIGITLGDPNGIGPEVVLHGLTDPRLQKFVEPLLIGSLDVVRQHAELLGYRDARFEDVAAPGTPVEPGVLPVLDVAGGQPFALELGRTTRQGGALAMQAVGVATDLCSSGELDAMVTAPISKEAISLAGYTEPGHTEFIARRCGSSEWTMMMISGDMRIGLVTAHMAIWDVPRAVTREAILAKIHIISRALTDDFGIDRPKVAVLGLNPHAGDGGVLGHEENDTIGPAIEEANANGFHAFGPFAADGFFAVGGWRSYDAVLAMYHDQGLIPFKTLAFDSGVNYTAGLPIVRTSPDHGTAFDLAGKGIASPGSMRSALYLALDIARRRRALRTA